MKDYFKYLYPSAIKVIYENIERQVNDSIGYYNTDKEGLLEDKQKLKEDFKIYGEYFEEIIRYYKSYGGLEDCLDKVINKQKEMIDRKNKHIT